MKPQTKKMRQRSPLRRMRMLRGLLQSELSRMSGVPQNTISLMEKNGIKRADKAVVLARALNCSVGELIDFTPCVSAGKQ